MSLDNFHVFLKDINKAKTTNKDINVIEANKDYNWDINGYNKDIKNIGHKDYVKNDKDIKKDNVIKRTDVKNNKLENGLV